MVNGENINLTNQRKKSKNHFICVIKLLMIISMEWMSFMMIFYRIIRYVRGLMIRIGLRVNLKLKINQKLILIYDKNIYFIYLYKM